MLGKYTLASLKSASTPSSLPQIFSLLSPCESTSTWSPNDHLYPAGHTYGQIHYGLNPGHPALQHTTLSIQRPEVDDLGVT